MSRQTKAYASAYQARDHESELAKGDVRTYACDFNAALRDGETVQSATWTSDRACVGLSGLNVSDGVATVTATAVDWGGALLSAKVSTSEGRVIQQRFYVCVRGECPVVATVSWP